MKHLSNDEFIREFAANGYTLQDSRIILKDFEETLYRIIQRGDSVRMTGFLDFQVKWVEPHMHRNPKTGEQVPVRGAFRVRIHPGYRFRNAMLIDNRECDSDESDNVERDA